MEVTVSGGDLVGVAKDAGKLPEEGVGGGKGNAAIRAEERGHGLEGLALQQLKAVLQAMLAAGEAFGAAEDQTELEFKSLQASRFPGTVEPERSRVDVALQMSRRRGA